MKRRTTPGFTIIEVMLFLAVGGMLAAAVLVGSGATIAGQRYHDAVIRFQSSLQQQYAGTTNTVNDRSESLHCDPTTAIVSMSGDGNSSVRGASDCEILGRFLEVTDGGTSLITSSVVGYRTDKTTEPNNDIEAFGQYALARLPTDTTKETLAWDVSVVNPHTDTPHDFTMLVLRSPLSGSLQTFISNDYHPGENEYSIPVSTVSALNLKQTFCVRPSGVQIGERLGIVVAAAASSQSAIEQQGGDSGC